MKSIRFLSGWRLLVATLVLAAASSAAAQNYLFNRIDVSTGTNPRSAVSADFNGDGIADLAIANQNCPNNNCQSGFVSILLGKADGTFQTHVDYDLGGNTFAMALATDDFNGDGKADLVVAAGSGVSVLLGNGDGTFSASTNYATGNTPSSVTTGDFNLDGKVDLVVANSSDSTVSVLLGNGDGTFQSPINYATGFISSAVRAADFNRDGKLDLVVVNRQDNSISIYLGNGDGTFQTRSDYPTGTSPQSVTTGDFNADGTLDLAVTGNTVSVLLGNGDGTFQPHVDYPAGGLEIASSDLNGDGKTDLVVTNDSMGFGTSVSVLLGNGDGTFQLPAAFTAGSGTASATIGDFNRDGEPDLAITNYWDNSVTILLGNGAGGFSPRRDFVTPANSFSVVAADFNKDGKLDLAVNNEETNNVSFLFGNGDGTFQPHVDYATSQLPRAVAAGDFNGDGILDLAVPAEGLNFAISKVSILLGNADGSFQPHVDYDTGSGPSPAAVADFNGDGKLDLAMAGLDSGSVSVLLGNGDGTFKPAVNYPLNSLGNVEPTAVAVADFNGDGKPDIAVSSGAGLSLLFGNGDGTFQSHVDYPFATGISGLLVADFDGDGHPDIVTQTQNGISVLLGTGSGSFQGPKTSAGNCCGNSFAAGDIDGDGKLDLVAANGGGVSVLLGKGDGTFFPHLDFLTGGASSVAVGDFNGDHQLDIASSGGVAQIGTTVQNHVSLLLSAPLVALSASRMVFAAQGIGIPSAASGVTVTNIGAAPLDIFLISISGDFSQTNNCPSTLAPHALCVIEVVFTPASSGTRSGTISISDSATSTPQAVSLIGNLGSLALSVSNVTFSAQLLGTSSAAKTVALTNPGNIPIALGEIAVGGVNSADFVEKNNCGSSIAAGGACALSISFTPTARGSRNARVTVFDALRNSPQAANLTGIGVAPIVTLDASNLRFLNQNLGTTSAAQTVTLTNTGDANLTISAVSVSGSFAQTNTCGTNVAIGASCAFSITFTPTALGIDLGQLTMRDNAQGSPHTIGLVGAGVEPVLSFSSSSLSFAGQLVGTASGAKTVVLSNTGGGVLHLAGISSTGDYSQANNCGASVAAGASCTVNITFSPSAAGVRSGNLAITDDAPQSPQNLPLTGAGTDFSLGAQNGATTSLAVTAGQTAVYNLQLSSVNGFEGTVSLSCGGAPSLSTCTVSSSSVTVAAGATVPFSVNVATTASKQAAGSTQQPSMRFGNPSSALLSLFGICLIVSIWYWKAAPSRRLRWRLSMGIAVSLVGLAACGGGNHNTGTITIPGTPAGSYTLLVTEASGGVNHTVNLQLTVN